jgi:hypothetical protein
MDSLKYKLAVEEACNASESPGAKHCACKKNRVGVSTFKYTIDNEAIFCPLQ